MQQCTPWLAFNDGHADLPFLSKNLGYRAFKRHFDAIMCGFRYQPVILESCGDRAARVRAELCVGQRRNSADINLCNPHRYSLALTGGCDKYTDLTVLKRGQITLVYQSFNDQLVTVDQSKNRLIASDPLVVRQACHGADKPVDRSPDHQLRLPLTQPGQLFIQLLQTLKVDRLSDLVITKSRLTRELQANQLKLFQRFLHLLPEFRRLQIAQVPDPPSPDRRTAR